MLWCFQSTTVLFRFICLHQVLSLIDLIKYSLSNWECTWCGLIDRNSTVVLCGHRNILTCTLLLCSSKVGRWIYFLTAPKEVSLTSTSQQRRALFYSLVEGGVYVSTPIFICEYPSQQFCVKDVSSVFCFEIESSHLSKKARLNTHAQRSNY